ncbi:MAG: hypothetical protein GF341_11930 [candidate division Zixibacteria bacterium]|nr:hypothetical protein [candidate division Zixibacteria bacterium]
MSPNSDNSRWPSLLLGVLIVALIIAGSISLVRFRNRDRGATQAIVWALDDMAAASQKLTAVLFAPQRYPIALNRFRSQIESQALPVDSVRAFYHEYALHARDGELDADDLRALGPFLGLTPAPASPDTSLSTTVPRVDTTSTAPVDTGSGSR